ncbi:MAG: hypothetical protein ACYTF9_14095 [Planctomycetota bacterium]
MRARLDPIGSALGILGMVICLVAVAGRFFGDPLVRGFEAIDIFIVGVGLIATACFAKLEARSASGPDQSQ